MASETKLNGTTWVPLAWVAACILLVGGMVGACVSGYVWLDEQFDGLRSDIQQVVRRVDSMDNSMRQQWSEAQMRAWVQLLAARNPTIVVPDVGR